MYAIDSRFDSDHPDTVGCQITGSVPEWLNGNMYRNGPGLYYIAEDRFKHLFDGMAVLHRYTIKDGQVSYHNRLVESQTYKKNKSANRIAVSEFGTVAKPDHRKSVFSRYFSYIYDFVAYPTDNTCISILPIGNKMFAFTETPGVNEIDPASLETKQHVDLRNYVSVNLATAHYIKDPDQTCWNFGTTFSHASYYSVIKIPPAVDKSETRDPFATLEVVCRIPSRWRIEPSYYHSFGMSENYLVLVEQNLAFPILGAVNVLFHGVPLCDVFNYYPNEKCLFHVVEKKSGKQVNVKFTAESFFVLHHVNTFEDGGHLVVDLCSYPDASILQNFKIDADDLKLDADDSGSRTGDQNSLPRLWRFVLPLNADKYASGSKDQNLISLDYTTASAVLQPDGSVLCSPQVFNDFVLEMPTTNQGVVGRKYRYCYGLDLSGYSLCSETRIIKFDLLKNKATVWSDKRYIPGEPIFVAKPDAKEEDDGVILSPLTSTSAGISSALLILDAATFREIARAEIPSNVSVPVTFHGIFCDSKDETNWGI